MKRSIALVALLAVLALSTQSKYSLLIQSHKTPKLIPTDVLLTSTTPLPMFLMFSLLATLLMTNIHFGKISELISIETLTGVVFTAAHGLLLLLILETVDSKSLLLFLSQKLKR